MAMNDPLGDMLTASATRSMRKQVEGSTPASKLRERVLDVLKTEGYIRGYATLEHRDGRTDSRSSSSISTAPR